MSIHFTGTGVALVTPFTDQNTIDFDGLNNLLDHVVGNGVDYLVINGTTAESATTSQEEKKKILKFTLDKVKGKLPIVYGIGGNNTQELIDKIESTDFSGIDAVLSVCPYYNKPSQEGIFQHYKAIATALPVPLILYNVPGRTGVNMHAKTTIRLSLQDNIIGIKEAGGDLVQAMDILKGVTNPGFKLISGDDLLTLPMMSVGAIGVISVLANAYPLEFSKMVCECNEGDFKSASQTIKKFTDINPLLYEEGNPVGIKQVLEHLGICKSNVRLPLVKASDVLKVKILEQMKQIN